MKLQLVCSLIGLLCGTNIAAADDFCHTIHSPYFDGSYPHEATVTDLATGTPEQVKACILSSLKQQRDNILLNIQNSSKDLADTDALIERWKKN